MKTDDPFTYRERIPGVMRALLGVERAITDQGQDPHLRHLVKLRASQINGCAFCVDMHLDEARQDGETQRRLDRLVVWRHVDDFSARERAALAWTESLTSLDPAADRTALKQALAEHFAPDEIAALTATIGMINLWNRLMSAGHGS